MATPVHETIYASVDRRFTSAVENKKHKMRCYHLPLKSQLLQRLDKYNQSDVPNFIDIRECTRPANFEKLYYDAWKAIEQGSMNRLKDSLRLMKAAYSRSGSCLDICSLQRTISQTSNKVTVYYMTLLAHAAVNKRIEMMKFLIKEGASIEVENVLTGSPLTQLFVHSMLHGQHKAISLEIVKLLIYPAILNRIVYYDIPVNEQGNPWIASPLSFAILLQRIDIAALLTEHGADPLMYLGDGIPTCMVEYLHFGTNEYFTWLFQQHLVMSEIAKFINQLLPKKNDILSEYCVEMFNDYYKHPIHAILTCGNEDVIRYFLAGDMTLLTKTDPNGRTALQIAAGQGDVVSVKLLLKVSWNQPNINMNAKAALLEAAENDRNEIVTCLLQRNASLGAEIVTDLTSKSTYTDLSLLSTIFETFRDYDQELLLHKIDSEDNTISHVAATNGNCKLFKVTFPLKSLQRMFFGLMKKNKSKKTPVHLAIENGRLNILKLLKEFGVEMRHKKGAEQKKEEKEWIEFWKSMGGELLLRACSCGSVPVLQTLMSIMQDCGLHFVKVWKHGLSDAASTNKREMIRHLLSSEEISNALDEKAVSSALLFAATYGHTRCVELLLNSNKEVNVRMQSGDRYNCLMKAIQGNHRETVLTIVSHEKYGFESLRFCRHVKTKDGATTPMRMLIVYMPDIAEWLLNASMLSEKAAPGLSLATVEDTEKNEFEFLEECCFCTDDSDSDPLVFQNRDAEQDFEAVQLTDLRHIPLNGKTEHQTMDKSSTTDRGTLTSHEVKGEAKCITAKNHPLRMMVDHDRESLLYHHLVRNYVNYKWITVGIAGIAFYFALYLIFLILLTSFALLIPRPGPQNNFCSAIATVMNSSSETNSTTLDEYNSSATTVPELMTTTINFTDYEGSGSGSGNFLVDDSMIVTEVNTTDYMSNTSMQGSIICPEFPDGVVIHVLRSISIILMTFSVVYLLLEILQLYNRKKHYLKEFENYVQVAMYTLTVVFVYPPELFGADCWCYPGWRWQIGAVALFLAWFNCCILLKDWPLVGQPVTMLVNVYFNFFKLFYLPCLLLLTFVFPLYMLHVREDVSASTSLLTFASPLRALWNIILQTTGELDTTTVFIETPLLYPVLTYILLVLFIIAMPLLFNNFLIGMAVGETEEERKKASLTQIKMKIRYTFEVENALKFLRLRKLCVCCHKLWVRFKNSQNLLKSDLDQLERDQVEKANKKMVTDMKSKFNAEDNQADLNVLREEVNALKLLISGK